MDITQVTDKKEIAYLLIQQQRDLAIAQANCQMLEKRLIEIENSELEDPTTKGAAILDHPKKSAKAAS